MKWFVLFGLLVSLTGCSTFKATPKDASFELLLKFQRGWNQQDAQGLADLFTDDAEWITVTGKYFKGKKAIAEQYYELFHGRHKDNRLATENTESKLIRNDTILLITDWQLRKTIEAGKLKVTRKRKGILSLLLVQNSLGEWKIAFAQGALRIQIPQLKDPDQ